MPYDLTLWNDTSFLAKEKHNKRTTERRACSGNTFGEDEEKPLLLGLYKQSFENPSNFIKSFL